jgi:transcriptional regulator with XRE-family HTH domain
MDDMPTMGPTKTTDIDRVAASLLKLARLAKGLSQRALAATAGVPHSTVARIESGAMQPTLPLLYRLLAAADLEPRIRLEAYDDHDDVLDALARRAPERQAELEHTRDATLAALEKTQPTKPRRRAG